VHDAEIEEDKTTPWFRYTQWPEQFRGRPLDVITVASCEPGDCPYRRFRPRLLGGRDYDHPPLVDKIKIRQLLRLLDKFFDHCEVTLANTPHVLRCWLKGYHQHRSTLSLSNCYRDPQQSNGIFLRFGCRT
jgi:hypothetical protein